MNAPIQRKRKVDHEGQPAPPQSSPAAGSEPARRKVRKVRMMRQASPVMASGQDADPKTGSQAPPPEPQQPAGPRTYVHFFHFDAETGKVSYIDDEKSTFGAVCECLKCGTVLQFESERCPVCGARFDEGDSGIVALLHENSSEWPVTSEMDCPQCGEHVTLVDGACPQCNASVIPSEANGAGAECGQLVNADNVIFVHLDVELGEVEYLQRLERNRGFEHLAVNLKDAAPNGSTEG